VRIARIFNTYGPRMCLDDGRVVSNFVAQVSQLVCFEVLMRHIKYLVLQKKKMHGVLSKIISVIAGFNAGTKKGGFDRLWGWEAN